MSRWARLALALGFLGCSVITSTEATQCSSDTDCYVKFGGGFTCQSGGCATSAALIPTESVVVTSLSACRATQECVAALGEGFQCRRDRSDPQKIGKCQQLAPSAECQVFGDYKNDEVIMLGALIAGKSSPKLALAVQSGITRALGEWTTAARNLGALTGPDAVSPPRPVAILACSEDLPKDDLRNVFLNSGTVLIIGPTRMDPATDELVAELTNAKVLFLSPTSVLPPSAGANIETFYYRVAGSENDVAAAIIAKKPKVVVRPAGRFVAFGSAIGAKVVEYATPGAAAPAAGDDSVFAIEESQPVVVLSKFPAAAAFALPNAIPDLAAAKKDGQPLPATLSSLKPVRSTVVPVPPFAATTFGDAEAYDATYLALTAVAAVPRTLSPEEVKTDVLRDSFLRVTDPTAGAVFGAAVGTLGNMIKALDVEGARLRLDGATGPLTFAPNATTTPRQFTVCAITDDGC